MIKVCTWKAGQSLYFLGHFIHENLKAHSWVYFTGLYIQTRTSESCRFTKVDQSIVDIY